MFSPPQRHFGVLCVPLPSLLGNFLCLQTYIFTPLSYFKPSLRAPELQKIFPVCLPWLPAPTPTPTPDPYGCLLYQLDLLRDY